MVLVPLVPGCFVDQVSMMLLTLPFFMPMVIARKIECCRGSARTPAREWPMFCPPQPFSRRNAHAGAS